MIDREPYLPELDRRPAALPGRQGPTAGVRCLMVALGLTWRPAAQAAMTMGPGEDKRDARHVSGGSQALSVKERRGSYHIAGGRDGRATGDGE
jgi:hypothetical protein